MISTFFLKENCNIKGDLGVLDIMPNEIINGGNEYSKLKSAIEWAISNNEDAIYCVRDTNFRYDFNIDYLTKIINDLVGESIFSIYVTADYNEFIGINSDFITISGISSISSFILLSPVYEIALSILNEFSDNSELDFYKFIELIIPNAFFLLKNDILSLKRNKIYIISPFRNVVNYIEDYISSLIKQSYTNYQILLIDDCSTDDGIRKIPDLPFVKKIVNRERNFALKNILNVLIKEGFDDEDVICLVDADDMLSHKYVLGIINSIYQNNSILMTYGSMTYVGTVMKIGKSYCKEEFDNLRHSEWKMSHLRTFKYKLFKELLSLDRDLDCFRNDKGVIFKMPYDMALLFPLMELAGFENIQFINTPTYKYRLHSDNDHFRNREEQFEGEMQIRAKSRLKQIF